MSSNLFEYSVNSNVTADFQEALTTGQASANVDLALPDKRPLWYIRAITLVSKENLDYELWLFTRAANLTGVIATELFRSVWQFNAIGSVAPAGPGFQVTPVASGVLDPLFHWYIDGNMMPYQDLDAIAPTSNPTSLANAKLHCRLINRNAVAKSAGVAGQLQVTFHLAAQQGT